MKNVGLIGSATGKLGNTVFYTRKGVTCSRVYQPTVANPNTIRQKLARARFTLAGQVSRGLIPAAKIGYADQLIGGESAYNVMVRNMLKGQAIAGLTPSTLEVNFGLLQLSKGVMSVPNYNTTIDNETALRLKLLNNPLRISAEASAVSIGVQANEVGAVIVVYCRDFKSSILYQYVPQMQVEPNVEIEIPQQWQGLSVMVYCFFKELPTSNLTAITTAAVPWRFPSRSSDTVFLGQVDVN